MYARKKQYVDMEIEARLGINKDAEAPDQKSETPPQDNSPNQETPKQ
jgi:hypothetical protein